MTYKAAIIIVNYEKYEDTIECIKSLEKLSEKDFITIIVDNASSNESVYYIEDYCSKIHLSTKIIKLSENLGFSAGNNEGIKAGRQYDVDYFIMLNNDTIVKENFLSELIRPFYETENVGATTGEIYYESQRNMVWYAGGEIRSKGLIPAHTKYNETEAQRISEMRDVTFASGCCICCSRESLLKIGGWDETFFLYEEDVDFSIRIVNAGYRIIYNSDAIIYHKVSSSTKSLGDLAQIYSIRNRLCIVKQHCSGMRKLPAYLINILIFLKRSICREYKLKNVAKGICCFAENRIGKL